MVYSLIELKKKQKTCITLHKLFVFIGKPVTFISLLTDKLSSTVNFLRPFSLLKTQNVYLTF